MALQLLFRESEGMPHQYRPAACATSTAARLISCPNSSTQGYCGDDHIYNECATTLISMIARVASDSLSTIVDHSPACHSEHPSTCWYPPLGWALRRSTAICQHPPSGPQHQMHHLRFLCTIGPLSRISLMSRTKESISCMAAESTTALTAL